MDRNKKKNGIYEEKKLCPHKNFISIENRFVVELTLIIPCACACTIYMFVYLNLIEYKI